VDVAGSFAGEEDDRAFKILGIAPATGGDAGEHLLAADRIVAQGLGVVGGNLTGADGVDVDTLSGPFVREGFALASPSARPCAMAKLMPRLQSVTRAAFPMRSKDFIKLEKLGAFDTVHVDEDLVFASRRPTEA
jgi:hypothetical protein